MRDTHVEFREDHLWINETLMCERKMSEVPLDLESWYYDIRFYLTRGSCPEHMDAAWSRALRLKSNQYHFANDTLYKINYDGVWLRCLEKDVANHVLKEMCDDPVGGHDGGETIVHKILRAGYYWPTMFRDFHAYAWKCKVCQIVVGWERKSAIPLSPVMIYRPFQQWRLDVIGEITPNSSQ